MRAYSAPKLCCPSLSLSLFLSAGVLHSALHGDIAQAAREATLAGFRSGRFNVLVATDVAARGLDINGIELVIQVCVLVCGVHVRVCVDIREVAFGCRLNQRQAMIW